MALRSALGGAEPVDRAVVEAQRVELEVRRTRKRRVEREERGAEVPDPAPAGAVEQLAVGAQSLPFRRRLPEPARRVVEMEVPAVQPELGRRRDGGARRLGGAEPDHAREERESVAEHAAARGARGGTHIRPPSSRDARRRLPRTERVGRLYAPSLGPVQQARPERFGVLVQREIHLILR